MVPDSEMWKIFRAVEVYRGRARLPDSKNCLDRRCKFNGESYRVRQLLREMEDDSEVGKRFMQTVYKTAKNLEYDCEMVGPPGINNYVTAIRKVTHPNTK